MKVKTTLLLLVTLFATTDILQAQVDQEPPTCDNRLNPTVVTANSITVTWNKATDDVTPQSELKYSLYCKPVGGEFSGILETLIDANTYTFTGLLPDTKYALDVVVEDNFEKKNYYYISSVKTGSIVVVTGVVLNQPSNSFIVGEKQTLNYIISPTKATNKKVTLTSDKPDVIMVITGTTEIVAVSPGKATITITTEDGNFTDAREVTVYTIGVEDAKAVDTYAAISGDMLYVTSSVAESISVYSIIGTLIYTADKPSGEIQIPLVVKGCILIVKGSSGWVQRVIKN